MTEINKKINKKGMGPAVLIALIAGVLILAVVLFVLFTLLGSSSESEVFKYATDWKGQFKWS